MRKLIKSLLLVCLAITILISVPRAEAATTIVGPFVSATSPAGTILSLTANWSPGTPAIAIAGYYFWQQVPGGTEYCGYTGDLPMGQQWLGSGIRGTIISGQRVHFASMPIPSTLPLTGTLGFKIEAVNQNGDISPSANATFQYNISSVVPPGSPTSFVITAP
jgi:hypothetical protein